MVIDALVNDEEVGDAARETAAREGWTDAQRDARVLEFAHEIVPHFRAAVYHRVAYGVARRFARSLYRVRVGYVDAARLSRIPSDATVIFVMNHRSNLDYVLVAFLAARHVAVSYAVGEWARVWPLDTLIRNLGGYFVRRRSKDPLYRKVLERYVQLAVSQGVVQGIFPEGGLSRDGRLRPPKVGLIAYAIRHFDPCGPRDLVFVPVGLNYDRVIEDRTLLDDLSGPGIPAGRLDDLGRPGVPAGPSVAARRSTARALATAVGWIAKHVGLYIRGRFYRLGYACVNFGTPRSFKEWLAGEGIDFARATVEQRGVVAERLVGRLMADVGAVMPLTPVSVVALALVEAGSDGLDEAALAARVQALLDEAATRGGRPYIPRRDLAYFFEVGLRMLTLRHLASLEAGRYRIVPGEERIVAYYANSIAQFFDDSASA